MTLAPTDTEREGERERGEGRGRGRKKPLTVASPADAAALFSSLLFCSLTRFPPLAPRSPDRRVLERKMTRNDAAILAAS